MGINVLDILMTKQMSPDMFNYELLGMPHWTNFLTVADVQYLHYIATSKKLAGNVPLKQDMIKQLMTARGFKRFAGGTNRVVYRHLECPTFLAKIAIDQVGMTDNPAEYKIQHAIKPFCAKMIDVTPCGTVGFAERVIPIKNAEEFKCIADDVFDVLYYNLLGKYILEDVGTKFFMNWGVRPNFGPVLLDYPYIYELDGNKLFCNNILPDGSICGGEIDYDIGFNHLFCQRCHKKYDAVQLKSYNETNQIVIRKGGSIPMKVAIVRGDEVLISANESNVINHPSRPKHLTENIYNAHIVKGNNEPAFEKKEEKAPQPDDTPANQPIAESVPDNSGTEVAKPKRKISKSSVKATVTETPVMKPQEVHEEPKKTVKKTTKTKSTKSKSVKIDSQFIPSRGEEE